MSPTATFTLFMALLKTCTHLSLLTTNRFNPRHFVGGLGVWSPLLLWLPWTLQRASCPCFHRVPETPKAQWPAPERPVPPKAELCVGYLQVPPKTIFPEHYKLDLAIQGDTRSLWRTWPGKHLPIYYQGQKTVLMKRLGGIKPRWRERMDPISAHLPPGVRGQNGVVWSHLPDA